MRRRLQALANGIEEMWPGVGFVVLMFDWGDKGRMNYISNANRDDMRAALRELLARMEGRYHEGRPG